MKQVMDYMVGSSAVQVVCKRNKIQVVDVEKREKKKDRRICFFGILLIALVMTVVCFNVVRTNNQRNLLEKRVAGLRAQVEVLEEEKEEYDLEAGDERIDYQALLKKAKKMGMVFPKKKQVTDYKVSRPTAVKQMEK
ncbi:MAG: hypothetical protein K6G62_08495 [Eubacterium sp.]|nr:hypothetical protein [Eubacterium sp.]